MLRQAFLVGLLCIYGIQCNIYRDLGIPEPDDYTNGWNFRFPSGFPFGNQNVFERRSDGDSDSSSSESREPLSPEYQDPNQKRTQSPKQHGKEHNPSFDSGILPDGIIDVSASDSDFEVPQINIPNIHTPFGEGFQTNFDFGFGQKNGGGGLFGLGGIFGQGDGYRPWWKGANVCVEREESTDDEDENTKIEKNATEVERIQNFFSTSISLSNCQQTPNKYECTTKINNHGVSKSFTVRYKCCYGFDRTSESSGCDKKIELKSLPETIEILNGKMFLEVLETSGLRGEINEKNYTVFLPSDESLNNFNDKMSNMNQVEPFRRRRNAITNPEIVRNHLVSGFVDMHYVANEELLNSENDNRTIRINLYPTQNFGSKLITANCVPIKKMNNFATNGIVHLVDGVVPTAMQSIQEIIENNAELSNLKQVLDKTNLTSIFKENGHYTIFAPTDAAFHKLDETTRSKILNGNACAGSILRHHIVSHTICSAAIIGNATTHNIDGEILDMEKKTDSTLKIEEVAIITKGDIIATNGVIHLIDTVIIPESALYMNDVLKKNNITKFQELIKAAEFEEDMDSFENATLFAPSNAALEKPESKEYLNDIMGNKEKLREFIKYHTLKGQKESCNMENDDKLETLAGSTVRVNLYSTLPLFTNIINQATVNCAKITNYNEKSCGAVIHEVDRILIPPTETILDIINTEEKYSTLKKYIKGTEIEKILSDEKDSITFAAPENHAFESIPEVDLKTLMDDKEKATLVFKNHIIKEVLCCEGVGVQTFGFSNVVPTFSGQHLKVTRSSSGALHLGRATVNKCDTIATNGVIHSINRVLFPQRSQNPNLGGYFFFDF